MDFQTKELNGELYDKNIDIVELQNKYLNWNQKMSDTFYDAL